jgi:hypothetical protein
MTDQLGKNMLIVTQSHMGEPTFSLIAGTESCPFVECVYTPQNKQLAIITKIQKDTFHFFTKIDDNGDVTLAKKARANGKTHKEERKQLKTFYEYYLTEEKEIIDFVNAYAVNNDGFKIANYTKKK